MKQVSRNISLYALAISCVICAPLSILASFFHLAIVWIIPLLLAMSLLGSIILLLPFHIIVTVIFCVIISVIPIVVGIVIVSLIIAASDIIPILVGIVIVVAIVVIVLVLVVSVARTISIYLELAFDHPAFSSSKILKFLRISRNLSYILTLSL